MLAILLGAAWICQHIPDRRPLESLTNPASPNISQVVPGFLRQWVERAKALPPGVVPGYDRDFRALLDSAAGICAMEE